MSMKYLLQESINRTQMMFKDLHNMLKDLSVNCPWTDFDDLNNL